MQGDTAQALVAAFAESYGIDPEAAAMLTLEVDRQIVESNMARKSSLSE